MWEFVILGVGFIIAMICFFMGSYIGFPIFLIGLSIGFFILLIPFIGLPFLASLIGFMLVTGLSLLLSPILLSPFTGLGGFMAIISLLTLGIGFFGMFGVPLLTQFAIPMLMVSSPLLALGGGGPIGLIALLGTFLGSGFLFI
jgi:hypothetical protein